MEQLWTRERWVPQAQAHAARVDRWVQPHLERRRRGQTHPVFDFMFEYYSHRPTALRRWNPGLGIALADASEYEGIKGYQVHDGAARIDPDFLAKQQPVVTSIHRLLSAIEKREPSFGCFGLHEWAMVYRDRETRHPLPLRLGAEGTDAVVDSHRIACSHFDAFRFFTPEAIGLNQLQPGRDNRAEFEQPGCLHAGMDLYKHAFRLSPLIDSSLVVDAFELAWEIRKLDMRASPYDLSDLPPDPDGHPWTPVKIETPEGKRDYAQAQKSFATRAAPLRRAILDQCARATTALASVPD